MGACHAVSMYRARTSSCSSCIYIHAPPGRTILHHTIANKTSSLTACTRQVEFLLRDHHAKVTVADVKSRRTVLHELADTVPAEIDASLAQLMLQHHAEVNRRDKEEATALTLAVKKMNIPLIKVLLEAKAEVSKHKHDMCSLRDMCSRCRVCCVDADCHVHASGECSSQTRLTNDTDPRHHTTMPYLIVLYG